MADHRIFVGTAASWSIFEELSLKQRYITNSNKDSINTKAMDAPTKAQGSGPLRPSAAGRQGGVEGDQIHGDPCLWKRTTKTSRKKRTKQIGKKKTNGTM